MKRLILGILLALPAVCQAGVVSGRVCDSNGIGIGGVPVSDGYEIVTTAYDGRYSIDTKKKLGLLFISTPSGLRAGDLPRQPS